MGGGGRQAKQLEKQKSKKVSGIFFSHYSPHCYPPHSKFI